MKNKLYVSILSLLFSFSLASATNHLITFQPYSYSPNSLTVVVGDSITWQGDFGNHPLSSNAVPSGAASFSHSSGSSYTYVVTTAGTYTYECTQHGSSDNMKGAFVATPSTNIAEPAAKPAFKIYPVAMRDVVNINVTGVKTSGNLTAYVYDILGQVAVQTEFTPGLPVTLQVSNLENGFYFVAIKEKDKVLKVVRVVKE